MRYERRTTIFSAAWRLASTLVTMLLLVAATAVSPVPAAAETSTPYIWAELHEMDGPCKDRCFRDLKPAGIAIVGTSFGPYESILIRFVSLDGSRESFTIKTEAYTGAGDFTARTGERVCDSWWGSPLEASGRPDEHAWEVRAEVLTTKSGAAISSNILYLYSCDDGPVG